MAETEIKPTFSGETPAFRFNSSPAGQRRRRGRMPATLISPIKTLIRSFRLILANFNRYLLIYLMTSLPLSLAQTSLSITLHSYRLLLRHPSAPRHISVSNILSRSLISLVLILPLSLLSSTSAISSTFSFLSVASPPPSLLSTVRLFPRVLATSICAHALTWLYLYVASLILSYLPTSASIAAFLIRVVAWAVEAHLLGTMSVAVVTSVVSPEVDVGRGALTEGWRAVGRRKWCAWSVTVGLAYGTGGIWGGVLMDRMDGQDWSGVGGLVRWMAGIGWRGWLVPLYGFLVLLSNVVYALLYWDYRRALYHRVNNFKDDDNELQWQATVVE